MNSESWYTEMLNYIHSLGRAKYKLWKASMLADMFNLFNCNTQQLPRSICKTVNQIAKSPNWYIPSQQKAQCLLSVEEQTICIHP